MSTVRLQMASIVLFLGTQFKYTAVGRTSPIAAQPLVVGDGVIFLRLKLSPSSLISHDHGWTWIVEATYLLVGSIDCVLFDVHDALKFTGAVPAGAPGGYKTSRGTMISCGLLLPLMFSSLSLDGLIKYSSHLTKPFSAVMSRTTSPSPVCSGQASPTMTAADSGYSSGSNSEIEMPEIYFTKPHLQFINRQLQFLEPPEILRWCITTLPHLFQTTAFGLSGLVTLDILSKLKVPRPQMVDVIFIDTLHHFPETLDLIERIRAKYPLINMHIYQPDSAETEQEFASKYGEKLWETDGERYDYLVKVEPSQRSYRELGVQAVLTGRRRSQGGKRGDLPIIEVDETGLIKINPMANWSFQQITDYIKENDVPYNSLLDQGYKSIGDWHSTQPVQEGEDERAGRWKGQEKTECGLHNPKSKYAQFLMEQEKKREREALEQALQHVSLES